VAHAFDTTAEIPLPRLDVLAGRLEQTLRSRAAMGTVPSGRRSAVLVGLHTGPRGPALLLTKRTAHLRHHPGQVSLPGGSFDDSDLTLATTALRETEEELGIDRSRVRLLGELDPVSTMGSDFVITPFVGVILGALDVVPEPYEIDRVLVVDVAQVLQHDATMAADIPRLELRYALDGEDVWGATARILRLFAQAVRSALAGPAER
jgi:8-oxo-dGTP pyrophosphatase MutT (NUDIX family)